MERLKYTVIKSEEQYDKYCKQIEKLLDSGIENKAANEAIELLTMLIEKWDDAHNIFKEVDPIELLHSLLDDHKLKAKDLAELLGISKGLVSNILNYKKGLSKESIRILANHFKVTQEAFNRPYILKGLLQPADKKTKSLVTRKLKMAG